MSGDNDNRDDGVYAALEAMDKAPPAMTLERAVTRLRAHGFGAEVDVLLAHIARRDAEAQR